jgi:iron complex transport system substrate-binding protein
MQLIRAATIALVLLTGCSQQAPATAKLGQKPMRIVSMNPCVDAILMEVADPTQIAAISHYSHDPRATSTPLKWALQYSAVSDGAEDAIAAMPDLVIAGPHVSVQTVAALNRLGIPLMQVAVPESVAQSKEQIAAIAARIGQKQFGDTLNSRIDRAIASASTNAPPLTALIWQGGGLVPGKGTLADEMLTRTGFRNISGTLGLKKWDVLPIEGLLSQPPTVLLSAKMDGEAGNPDANRMLSHSVLRKAGATIRIAHFPSNLLHCGGPTIIRAVARLAEVRQSLEAQP